mmetsp:Transcript_7848/g.24673  ORF Transcript_7848/g.24673 Transcript_7848/m.24673 type:complete len:203 (+) Transcript_7848:1806-2414(+)
MAPPSECPVTTILGGIVFDSSFSSSDSLIFLFTLSTTSLSTLSLTIPNAFAYPACTFASIFSYGQSFQTTCPALLFILLSRKKPLCGFGVVPLNTTNTQFGSFSETINVRLSGLLLLLLLLLPLLPSSSSFPSSSKSNHVLISRSFSSITHSDNAFCLNISGSFEMTNSNPNLPSTSMRFFVFLSAVSSIFASKNPFCPQFQ